MLRRPTKGRPQSTFQRGIVSCQKCLAPIHVFRPSGIANEFSARCNKCGNRGLFHKHSLKIDALLLSVAKSHAITSSLQKSLYFCRRDVRGGIAASTSRRTVSEIELAMSALTPRADMCGAKAHVYFGHWKSAKCYP